MAGDVTGLLTSWKRQEPGALAGLMPLVYRELRQIAGAALRRERPDHTLQPTALVHEVFLRLTGLRVAAFSDRAHFYGVAARSMRRVLVDHSRRRGAAKRGEGWARVSLDEIPASGFNANLNMAELDDALTRLASVSPRAAEVFELRCFAGLSVDDTATVLSVGPATVKRHWTFARAWLMRHLS